MSEISKSPFTVVKEAWLSAYFKYRAYFCCVFFTLREGLIINLLLFLLCFIVFRSSVACLLMAGEVVA